MVSPRRSDSSSGNNDTTPPDGSSGKRSPSPSQDISPSPKRQKLEGGGGAASPAKDTNTLPPADSGKCVLGDTNPTSGDAKIEPSALAATTAPSPPVAIVSTPILQEKPNTSSFRGWTYVHSSFKRAWCLLLTQSPQLPSISIRPSTFTFGSSKTYSYGFMDRELSSYLFKITRLQRKGNVVAVLETTGSRGPVRVNRTRIDKNVSHVLNSGDEIVFGYHRCYAFIYQQMSNVAATTGSVRVPARKFLELERKAKDPTGNPIISSLASLQQASSRRKSSSHASSKSNQAPNKPATSVVQVGGMEGDLSVNNQSNKAADSGAVSHNQDSKMEILDEKNEVIRNSQQASTSGNGMQSAILREGIQAGIVEGESLEVSFNKFPYYLSEKACLLSASYVHLKKNEYAQYASNMITLNPKILLSGPAGSEIYQEMLAKALANYFEAKLLIFDSHPILGALSAMEIESLKDELASRNTCKLPTQSPDSDSSAGEGDVSSSSGASSDPDSQPVLEPQTLPRSFQTPVNHTLKKGMPHF